MCANASGLDITAGLGSGQLVEEEAVAGGWRGEGLISRLCVKGGLQEALREAWAPARSPEPPVKGCSGLGCGCQCQVDGFKWLWELMVRFSDMLYG